MTLNAQRLRRYCAVVCATLILTAFHAPAQPAATTNATTRKSPEWLRNSVVYEIFPRSFSATGDFKGITARLDELKDLGMDVLWLMPIHPIGQKMKKGSVGSPYCVRDYFWINSDYGTKDDFKQLVNEAHRRGMKVIMDVVAGHTSWDSVLIQDHPEYFQKDEAGNIIPPNPEWTDVAALDYTKPEVRRYMTDMMKFWVQEYGVDGFRCDVAYTVPIDFWEAARAELEKVNPEIIILASAGAKPVMLSKAFDMDYSWHLAFALNRVMSGVAPAYFMKQSWEHTEKQYPKGSLHLRYSDSHSETRAVARYGIDGALAAQVLMLTLDGVPLFYNGMEVGDATESNDPALFERVPIFWNPGGRPPLQTIYRDLIKLRKAHSAFANDDVIWLQNSAPGEVVTFMRKDAKDEFVVIINLSSRRVTGSVELDNTDGFDAVRVSSMPEPVSARLPDFTLKSYGWFIYHRSLGK